MSTNTVSVSPCGVGAISSGLGLGAGYILAPRKYSLERLLMQNDKTYDRIFSQSAMKNATSEEKKSVENLRQASKTYRDSGIAITKEKIAPEAKTWHDLVKQVNVDDSFVSEVTAKKAQYQQALKDVHYKELKDSLEHAHKKVAENPKDTNAYLELKSAAREFAEAELAVKEPLNQYKKARTAFRSARENAILNLPDKGRSISEQWEKVTRAISDRANLMYKKLATLTSNEGLKNDYSIVKKYIPKSRTYSSLMGGIIAGISGVIAGVYALNKSRCA